MAPAKAFYVICLISSLGMSPAVAKEQRIEVSQVVKSHDGGGFTCKVKDLPKVGPARVRVGLRGLKSFTNDAQAKKAGDFTSQALSDAGRIILKNVRMRNYFRMEADVEIDGKSLAGELVAAGIAETEEKPVAKPQVPSSSVRAKPVSPILPTSRRSASRSVSPRGPVRVVNPSVQLKKVVEVSRLTPDTTFAEALEILCHSVDPPLPLVVMWKDIEENGLVEKTTPIGIAGMRTAELKQALVLILKSVSAQGNDLEYVSEGGIITIASKSLGLGKRRYARVYDAGELLAAPATGLGGMGGMFGGGYGGGGYGGYGGGSGGYGNSGFGSFGSFGGSGNRGSYGRGSYNNRRRPSRR